MNKQQALIQASVQTASHLLAKRSQDSVMVSDVVFTYLGKICNNYDRFDSKDILDIINDNIVYLNRSIAILDIVHDESLKHDDVLDLIYLEKARSELEAARFRCYDEENVLWNTEEL